MTSHPVTAPAPSGAGGRCGAKTRAGGACGRPAGWGTDHVGAGRCKLHGGSTPNGRKNAQRIIAERTAETYGLPVETTPQQALLDEVRRTAGHVAWLSMQVRELRDDAVPGSPWLDLYHRERRHLADVSAKAIAAGVSERLVSVAEVLGDQLGGVIAAILEEAGRVVGRELLGDPAVADVVRRQLLALGPAAETVDAEDVA